MMIDTTWRESLVDPQYGADHSFDEWFKRYFTGSLEPQATGGFEEVFGYRRPNVLASCKECGALVLHDMRHYGESVVHLNAHRAWHDKLASLFGGRGEQAQ